MQVIWAIIIGAIAGFVARWISPSPHNPLGVKGVGEVGVIPTAAAIISAVEDALSPFGIRIAQMPVTPSKLVELIERAKARKGATA